MNQFFHTLFFAILPTIIGASVPVLMILIFLKRRRNKQLQVEGVSKGTKADLEQAEAELQKLPIDIRETLTETHELYDRYFTHRGYSTAYMESLTKAIRDTGLDCQMVFQDTLFMGVADAVIDPQGVFELYVPRGKMNEARKTIPALIESTVARE